MAGLVSLKGRLGGEPVKAAVADRAQGGRARAVFDQVAAAFLQLTVTHFPCFSAAGDDLLYKRTWLSFC